MATGNTLIHSLKIVLMSTGAIFIIAILVSPFLNDYPLFTSPKSDFFPSLWFSLGAWLRPPYLYVIINGIIITIAASSRLHHAPLPEDAPHAPPKIATVRTEEFSPYDVADSYYSGGSVKDVDVDVVISTAPAGIEERERRIVEEFEIPEGEIVIGDEMEKSVVTDEVSTWIPPRPLATQNPVDISPELISERPPATSRFTHHRRPAKVSPAEGGKALRRVTKPKRHETLENTWKAITEGRAMPLTRHLRKSDTWETHARQINVLDSSTGEDPSVKKSETFSDRTNYNMSRVITPSILKKEPSLNQEELNRRVEAFINKFNEEMRLQRQQSIEQFMNKINRI